MDEIEIVASVDAEVYRALLSGYSVIAMLPEIMEKLQAAYRAGVAHGVSGGGNESVAVAKKLIEEWNLLDAPAVQKVVASVQSDTVLLMRGKGGGWVEASAKDKEKFGDRDDFEFVTVSLGSGVQQTRPPAQNSLQNDLVSALEPFARLCPDGVPLMGQSESLVKHVHLKDVHRAQQLLKLASSVNPSDARAPKESAA